MLLFTFIAGAFTQNALRQNGYNKEIKIMILVTDVSVKQGETVTMV